MVDSKVTNARRLHDLDLEAFNQLELDHLVRVFRELEIKDKIKVYSCMDADGCRAVRREVERQANGERKAAGVYGWSVAKTGVYAPKERKKESVYGWSTSVTKTGVYVPVYKWHDRIYEWPEPFWPVDRKET